VNDEEVFKNNFLSSPIFGNHLHQIVSQRGFRSAALAYNDAIKLAKNDLLVFCHQDVYFPENWDLKLEEIISHLDRATKWGMLGCFGISIKGEPVGHAYSYGLGSELGMERPPVQVQSLDEFVLVMRKSSGLKFDPSLNDFHLFGTDICLEAEKKGFNNYSISNYCIHNSISVKWLPPAFWKCAEYLRKKWIKRLPVKTCCVTIKGSRMSMLFTRIKFSIITLISILRKKRIYKINRLDDPSCLMR
jgi:glycosyltransferase involved in cell wall biosynthesis